MTPQSGTWIGTFVPAGSGQGVQLTLTLDVRDDGSITGSFDVDNRDAPWWAGPTHGDFAEGGYTPYGSLHLEEEGADGRGDAVLDARFHSIEANSAVLWGTILIELGKAKQRGTLVAVFAKEPLDAAAPPVPTAEPEIALPHVWGG
jgi:hypothetical protein